jgi:hypothetical protein
MSHSLSHFLALSRARHRTGQQLHRNDSKTITDNSYADYSSDHNRIVRSFSIDAEAIKFRVGCV